MKDLKLFFKTFGWILKNENIFSIKFIKSLALLPRSFDLYDGILRSRPDVVHLFWGHFPSILGFIVLQSKINSKVTMFLGAYDLELKLGLSSSLGKSLGVIFTHANFNKPLIKDLCGPSCSVCVAHRGVDLNLLGSIAAFKKVNRSWVTAGRLIYTKRFDKVIELFRQYHELYPDATLTIVGDGPHRASLEQKVETLGLVRNVSFRGFVSQYDLFKILSKSTHFVFLSEKVGERLPNVVKEAMYYENFCIVSDTPGIDELIVNYKEGLIVKDTVDSLVRICELEPFAKEIGRRAKDKIEHCFDSELQMDKYLSFWKGKES